RFPVRSFWRDSDGTALVEGAIVVPVLCLLVFGVFEFSSLFYQQHRISTGVRDAARYLARTSNPNDSTPQANANNLATRGNLDATGGLRVNGWTASDVTVSVATVTDPTGVTLKVVGYNDANQKVTVSTDYAIPELGFFEIFGLSAPTLSVSHSERVIVD